MPLLSDSHRRRLLVWLMRLRGSPEAIARGVSVGMLVAFTPTIGVQTLLALGLATLVGANRPVSIVPTWITNPVTIPPVYGVTYALGSLFWSGPEPGRVASTLRLAAEELAALDFLALEAQLGVVLDLGVDIFVPLWIGGLIVGLLAAAISYPITLRTVTTLRAARARSRERRRRQRAERSGAGPQS